MKALGNIKNNPLGDVYGNNLGDGPIAPGQIYTFYYDNYQHDKTPLAIVIKYESQYKCWMGVNLHYLHPEVRMRMMSWFYKTGNVNDKNQLKISTDYIKKLIPDMSICIRRYKTNAMRFIKFVPLDKISTQIESLGDMESQFRAEMWQKSKTSLQSQYT